MQPCIFCGRSDGGPSKEHAIPKWARDSFSMPSPVVLRMRVPGEEMHDLHTRPHLNIVLEREVCARCNNDWLSDLEKAVGSILAPMATECAQTRLGVDELTLLSTWAVKTSYLFERSVRQKYAGRPADGTVGSSGELAWLFANGTPPPMSMVWLGCYDCQKQFPVTYEPSGAPLLRADGDTMPGHLVTMALGFVAFQAFTVDFVAAEAAGAWRGWPLMPENLKAAVVPIWPNSKPIDWPVPAFKHEEWNRLVTWDGALRAGRQMQPASS